VLRQLRAGYTNRPSQFPSTIVLCGVRDVRDYRIHSDQEKTVITGGSAFNIKAESLRLGNFSRLEVLALYRQHTEETGQAFETGALDKAWDLTGGQPWLVNALAYETCFRMPEGQDRSMPVACEMISRAKENMITQRDTHLDKLADKLREERVRRVIEPLLAGTTKPEQPPEDDVQYVEDLGLITTKGQMRISNEIYREVIPRVLTYTTQITIVLEPAWYIQPDGRLDLSKLLQAFQQFFREHSESWLERFDYREAGPQLLMQAFLQRIVNGGGTDLLVIWPFSGGVQRAVHRAEGHAPVQVPDSSGWARPGPGVCRPLRSRRIAYWWSSIKLLGSCGPGRSFGIRRAAGCQKALKWPSASGGCESAIRL